MTESQTQEQIARYIATAYPLAVFHSDFGSGARLTPGQAAKQKRQNGGRRAWPDIFIAEPVEDTEGHHWHGLFIELKKEGVRVFKKDGTIVANQHFREQDEVLKALQLRGFATAFGIGFDQTRELIDQYMKGEWPWASSHPGQY